MTGTTHVERLGAFAANASFDQLSEAAIVALKLRLLDSLDTALGALDAEPVALVRRQVDDTLTREPFAFAFLLECLRRGIWGAKSLWGRVVTSPGA